MKAFLLCDPLSCGAVSAAVEGAAGTVLAAREGADAVALTAALTEAAATSCDLVVIEPGAWDAETYEIEDAVRRLRTSREAARIIVLLPEGTEPDAFTTELVGMGIYDLVSVPPAEIGSRLSAVIAGPATYAAASRWQVRKAAPASRRRDARPFRPSVAAATETIVERIVGCAAIAVAGVGPRVGTTHLVVSVARFLAHEGHAVACVLMNEAHWRAIAGGYEGVAIDETRSRFELGGVAYYLGAPSHVADYHYVVLDFGVYEPTHAIEFKRSPVRLLVSGSAEWDLAETTELLRADPATLGYTVCFALTSPDLFAYIAENMGGARAVAIPYNPEWGQVEGVASVMAELVGDVLPRVTRKGGRS
ncbi:MAG: hypothetical protein Q7J82_06720 [Coriobacteriia bacterium]|nr:hypothetical protein [Coriobacteriia bacterium]